MCVHQTSKELVSSLAAAQIGAHTGKQGLFFCRACWHVALSDVKLSTTFFRTPAAATAAAPAASAAAPQVGLHLGKATSRYTSQLKVVAPQHPMVARAAAGEEAFDRAVAAVA